MHDAREYNRLYHRRRYVERVTQMHQFLGGICVVCGTTENLEIHHRELKAKKFTLTNIYSHPWARIEEELMKCELRCDIHHKDRHAASHGTGRRYKRGCRCDLCVGKFRADGRKYSRKYKERKRSERLNMRV